jgi:hypothetical protein
MSKVYLVISSMDYEGGHVRGIYKTKPAADKACESLKQQPYFGDWADVVETQTGRLIDIELPYNENS